MSPARRKISAREVIQDIRNGMTHTDLMKKYALSFEGLFSLLNKMVDAGLLTQSEVDDRLRTGGAEKAGKGKEYGRGLATEVPIQSDTLSRESEQAEISPGIINSSSSKRRKISAGLISFLVFAGLIAYLIMPSNRKPRAIEESEDIKREVAGHFSQSEPLLSSGRFSITDAKVLNAKEGRLTKETASQKDILPLKLEDDREKLLCITLLANVVEKTDTSQDPKESGPGIPCLFNLYVLRSYSGKLRGTNLTETDLKRGYNCPDRWDDLCPFTCDEHKSFVAQLREKRRREIADQKTAAQQEQVREKEEADRIKREETEKQEEERNRKAEEIARRDRLLLEAVEKQDAHKVGKLLSEGANAQSQDHKGLTPLMIAAKNGQLEIVELLLSKGADINSVNSEGDSALVLAAMNGRSELVEFLFEKGASPNAKDSNGTSALTLAFRSGDAEKVTALARLGANIQESENESPLLIAGKKGDVKMLESILETGPKISADTLTKVLVEAIPQGYRETKGHVETVRFLITKGAYVNSEVPLGRLPLQVALKADQPQIFSEFLAGGADPNKLVPCCTPALLKKPEFMKIFFTYGDKLDKQSLAELLMEAITQGQVETVRILVKQGADADSELRPGRLPLQVALKEDKPQIFSELLAAGADPNKLVSCCIPSLLKKEDFTKLLLAHEDKVSPENKEKLLKAGLEKGLPSVAIAILKLGFKGNFKSDSGQPLLILACEKDYNDVVELLLKQGAEINESDRNGNTALMESSRLGKIEIVKLLLDNGAKPNLKNGGSNSALALACAKGRTEVVKLLLDTGADPALRLLKNSTCLMHAVVNNQIGAAKVLCTTPGNEINATDEHGGTALMYAFYKGDRGLVRLLLEHNADINVQDEKGHTALASYNGNIQMIKLLLEHNADVNVKNKDGKTALGLADNAKQKEAVKILKDKGAHY